MLVLLLTNNVIVLNKMKVKLAGRERLYVDILCSVVLWLLLNNTSSYNL